MALRELKRPPGMLGLYARAAVPLLPGASLLPFVGGKGSEIPELELRLPDLRSEADRLAAYAKVCGFTLRDELPASFPHVLAFPLHMALMTDPSFPFAAVGLVHIENRIVQHEPIGLSQPLDLHVRATPLQLHPKGKSFSIITDAQLDGRVVWSERSTMLRRGPGSAPAANGDAGDAGDKDDAAQQSEGESAARPSAQWQLPGDLGRRYAAVSGDRNPIHMHSLSAKAFGFPRAIAHGMWSLARCLAALEGPLPDTFIVDVRFGRPILLPAKVSFTEIPTEQGVDMELTSSTGSKTHLRGTVGNQARTA
jgi:acyl dehydratase